MTLPLDMTTFMLQDFHNHICHQNLLAPTISHPKGGFFYARRKQNMYSPRGGSNPGGPGLNALAMPQQQQTAPIGNNALAGNYGTGLMQGAADIKTQYPIWQQQYMDGTTTLQFPEWLKGQQGQNNPTMPAGSQQPRQQNSMGGYGPRGYG